MIRIVHASNLVRLRFHGYANVAGGRWRRQLQRAMQALGAGASTIPLGDNGDVFRALAQARETQRIEQARSRLAPEATQSEGMYVVDETRTSSPSVLCRQGFGFQADAAAQPGGNAAAEWLDRSN